MASLFRYWARALELPPYPQAVVDRRAQQLHEEFSTSTTKTSTDATSEKIDSPNYLFHPLIPTLLGPITICLRLHKRIAEYAHKLTNTGSSEFSALKLQDAFQYDAM